MNCSTAAGVQPHCNSTLRTYVSGRGFSLRRIHTQCVPPFLRHNWDFSVWSAYAYFSSRSLLMSLSRETIGGALRDQLDRHVEAHLLPSQLVGGRHVLRAPAAFAEEPLDVAGFHHVAEDQVQGLVDML